MAVSFSALRAGRLLPQGRFLVLISVKSLSRPQGYSAAGRIRSIGEIHLIGNRTRDFPGCSTVPQPTTLTRAPGINSKLDENSFNFTPRLACTLGNILLVPNRNGYQELNK
jgi:hypothetical protein